MYVVGVGLVKVYKALIRRGLEKEMAIHSSILAWKIPWTEEPGWLQSTGSHDLATKPPPICYLKTYIVGVGPVRTLYC